jgi:hypothetical protein
MSGDFSPFPSRTLAPTVLLNGPVANEKGEFAKPADTFDNRPQETSKGETPWP